MSTPATHRKGYPTDIFRDITVPIAKYLCVLCGLILNNPVQRFCGHRYCKNCVDEANAASDGSELQCPACAEDGVDEEPQDSSQRQIFADNAIRREMSTLPTVCCHPGCSWTGLFKEFVDHYEQHSGSDETNRCPFGCGLTLDSETNLNDHTVARLVEHFNVIFSWLRTLTDTIGDSAATAGATVFGRLGELQRKLAGLQSLISDSARSGAEQDVTSTAQPAAAAASAEASPSMSTLDSATITAWTTEKMPVLEGVITVLNREMEKMTVDMEALERQRSNERELMDNMDRKLRSMERLIAMKDATINELNIRLTSLEQISYDGTLLWRVSEIQKKRQEAVSGRVTSVYSPPFFTSRTGYKMCLRMYLNGDGMGKGSHLSIFFVVMRGMFDALLRWPFRQKVTLMLLSQHQREHVVDAFRPDPTSSSFKRPTTEMNIASGCPLFASLDVLDSPSNGYVKDDHLFLKAVVDCSDLT